MPHEIMHARFGSHVIESNVRRHARALFSDPEPGAAIGGVSILTSFGLDAASEVAAFLRWRFSA